MTSTSDKTAPAQPLVYGYVRCAVKRPTYVAACHDALVRWCGDEDWQLGAVFTDASTPPRQLIRPGFTALLDALSLPGVLGVVVVDAAHFSSHPSVVTSLVRRIRDTGAAVLVMDGTLPPVAQKLCQDQPVLSWRC